MYVWSIARAFGGSVIVRIEDHDRQRARAEYETSIRDDLRWLGLAGDNAALSLPPALRQHDAGDAYAATLARLEAQGLTYSCRCSRRGIAALGDTASERRYPGTCRDAAVPASETQARRLRLTDEVVHVDDLRHGALAQQPSAQCGDLLLRDRLGQWTYQYSVVVDDLRHGVTLVIRGDDLLESTGRQRLLARLLGETHAPSLLHHPLLRHPDGAKLSKSRGDAGLSELRGDGWSPEQVLGHAAWLGGLQTTPMPLKAAQLGTLWDRGRRDAGQ